MKCGVANEQNLRPGEYQLTHEEQKKGGIASGAARRKKADLRKAFREAMETTYTDKKTGRELTGEEIVIQALMANLANANGRNFGKSLDAALTLLGAKETPTDEKIKKAQLELLKAQAEKVKKNGADDENVTVIIDV